MNYLAHGWQFTDKPYVLAGTAAPDWLSVIDRKIRLRSRTAAEFVNDPDPILAAVARGVVQHHADDAWFHALPAFNELSLAFAVEIRKMQGLAIRSLQFEVRRRFALQIGSLKPRLV